MITSKASAAMGKMKVESGRWVFTTKVKAAGEVRSRQGCINRGTCSHPELTQDQVLTSAYVIIFCTVATNAVNKSV